MSRWSDKDPTEIIPLGIDFALLLADDDALLTASAAIALLSGTDADPSTMLLGSAAIVGTSAQQWVQGGVDGCVYRVSFTVDSTIGKRLVESAEITVRGQ